MVVVLPAPVRTNQAKDFPFGNFKGNLRDGHRSSVGLADAGNFDNWAENTEKISDSLHLPN